MKEYFDSFLLVQPENDGGPDEHERLVEPEAAGGSGPAGLPSPRHPAGRRQPHRGPGEAGGGRPPPARPQHRLQGREPAERHAGQHRGGTSGAGALRRPPASLQPDGAAPVQRQRQSEEKPGSATEQHGAARRHAAGRQRQPQGPPQHVHLRAPGPQHRGPARGSGHQGHQPLPVVSPGRGRGPRPAPGGGGGQSRPAEHRWGQRAAALPLLQAGLGREPQHAGLRPLPRLVHQHGAAGRPAGGHEPRGGGAAPPDLQHPAADLRSRRTPAHQTSEVIQSVYLLYVPSTQSGSFMC